MQKFTIMKAPVALNPTAFDTLTPGVSAYLDREINVVKEVGEDACGIARQFFLLEHISFNNWMALSKLGCDDLEELWRLSSYQCHLSGSRAQSVLPVGILTKNLAALRSYGEMFDRFARSGAYKELLHVLPDQKRFDLVHNSSAGLPNRFETIQMGCGYTLNELGTRGVRRAATWVGLKLSNGDELVALAFKAVPVDDYYMTSRL